MAKKKKNLTEEKSAKVAALARQLAETHFVDIEEKSAENLAQDVAKKVAQELIEADLPLKEDLFESSQEKLNEIMAVETQTEESSEGFAEKTAPQNAEPDAKTEQETTLQSDTTVATNLVTDRAQIKQVIEAVIFAAPKSISTLRLKNILTHFQYDITQMKEIIDEMIIEYQDKGFQLVKVGSGFQFRTHPGQAEVLQKLLEDKPARLSASALEVLSIIAYKQPVTRAEIDGVRGVDSGHLMKGLLEKNLVRSVGHAETPGRPLLFGTTPYFLEVFTLNSLDDLPNTEEMKRELAVAEGSDGILALDGNEQGMVLSAEAQGGYDGLLGINSGGLAAEPDRGIFDTRTEEAEEKPDFGVEERAREELA
jgi:segregation and condensation protein B